ncbi:MAG: hypothetical protein ACREJB_13620, partial [Planctomycetaceae bacterium]
MPDPAHQPAATGPDGGYVRRVLIAALVLFLAVVLLVLFHAAAQVVLMAFAGVLLAVFLSTLSGWLSGRLPLSYR